MYNVNICQLQQRNFLACYLFIYIFIFIHNCSLQIILVVMEYGVGLQVIVYHCLGFGF